MQKECMCCKEYEDDLDVVLYDEFEISESGTTISCKKNKSDRVFLDVAIKRKDGEPMEPAYVGVLPKECAPITNRVTACYGEGSGQIIMGGLQVSSDGRIYSKAY